ncbi:MYND-type domain-containing protein [Mycena chlorophos]|uniref:MYND-type domain-containing protein n=1 Tax=Mycena chlorophos TaxID=658473 RepID=A0A8H6SKX5_MYCCL|nr:MYND-type domain-containing protein [Mycena chlorophos]
MADLKVHLPLPKLDNCAICQSTQTLRLCSACHERIYCSPTCQKADWAAHKASCGKTDRLDLDAFYPFLACLVESAHTRTPTHPGILQSILNAPNPGTRATRFPDGSAANLVVLGDPLTSPDEAGSERWFPNALDTSVRSKFYHRIKREGHVLPILVGVALALLSQIYTTTGKRRVRLAYRSSPIADFGIASGSTTVQPQDRLAYLDAPTDRFFPGQDPDEHYWLYFTTIRGETVTLDCAMFTFNFCFMVGAWPYTNAQQWVPAFFREREFERNTPGMYRERMRASVLRDAGLCRFVESANAEKLPIQSFMESLAQRKLPQSELDFALQIHDLAKAELAQVITTRRWERWPKTAPFMIEQDPDEIADDAQDDDEAWAKYIRRFKKDKKAGATREQLDEAYKKWQAKQKQRRV